MIIIKATDKDLRYWPLNYKTNYVILNIDIITNCYNLNAKLRGYNLIVIKFHININIYFQICGSKTNKLQPVNLK